MKKGAVLVDVAIDQGGCFETSHATTHADPTYVVDGVVHYCVANMPGAVARTSTYALNNATLPFVLALANKGWGRRCMTIASAQRPERCQRQGHLQGGSRRPELRVLPGARGTGGLTMAQRPFWLETGTRHRRRRSGACAGKRHRADVCIVGGGFTGLWTAIMVKRRARAGRCRAGGRYLRRGRQRPQRRLRADLVGQVLHLARLFGDAEAVRLVQASEQRSPTSSAFCTEHAIVCEWRRHGTLFTATSPAQLGASDAVIAALEAAASIRGTRADRRTAAASGSRPHLEGWYSPLAATVQPGKLVRGLRRVALDMGVRLHEQTPMIGCEEDSPPVVHTPRAQSRPTG